MEGGLEESRVTVATGERPRPLAEAEPAETDKGFDWQSAQWAGTIGRALSLIGSWRGHFSFAEFFFFLWLLIRAFLIGLLREDPPLPASYWMTADNSDWRMRSKQTLTF